MLAAFRGSDDGDGGDGVEELEVPHLPIPSVRYLHLIHGRSDADCVDIIPSLLTIIVLIRPLVFIQVVKFFLQFVTFLLFICSGEH